MNLNLVNLTIHGANDLAVADVFNSDGYVIVRFNGKIIYRTKTIEKNLNPVWNEYCFVAFPSRQNAVLRLEIYDTDKGKDDDLLGYYELNLSTIPYNEPVKERSCPITNAAEYKATSSITISLSLLRYQMLQFPIEEPLAPEEMMKISYVFQSKLYDRPTGDRSPFHLFVSQMDFIWSLIEPEINEYLIDRRFAHLKYLLECYYTEFINSFHALKTSLQVIPSSSSFPSNSDNSSRESQFRELIFYLFQNNRKILSILQSKKNSHSNIFNLLSPEQQNTFLLSHYIDYSKLLEEYQYVLLWKMNYFISCERSPPKEFLSGNIFHEFEIIHEQFLKCYHQLKQEQKKKSNHKDLYQMEINALENFFNTFPLVYYTLLLQFAEQLKNLSEQKSNTNNNMNVTLNVIPGQPNFNINVKNDTWYCTVLNICAFILETSNWKFSPMLLVNRATFTEQYEKSIQEVTHRYELLQEYALQQLSNIAVNLVYSQFLVNSNDGTLSSSSSSSSSRTFSSSFHFSLQNLFFGYQQQIVKPGNSFQLFTQALVNEVLLVKPFYSLKMWSVVADKGSSKGVADTGIRSKKQFQLLQLEMVNKLFFLFYNLLFSCYDHYSKEFAKNSMDSSSSSLSSNEFSILSEDQQTLSSLAADMNECLHLLQSNYFVEADIMMQHPSIQMMQIIIKILLTSDEEINEVDKMKKIFKQARQILNSSSLSSHHATSHYSKEMLQQSLKVCFALKGFYFYFNQIPYLFAMNGQDFVSHSVTVAVDTPSSPSVSSRASSEDRPSSSSRVGSFLQSVSSLFGGSTSNTTPAANEAGAATLEMNYQVHPSIKNRIAVELIMSEIDHLSHFPIAHTPAAPASNVVRMDAFAFMFPSRENANILREFILNRWRNGLGYSFDEEFLASPGYFALSQSHLQTSSDRISSNIQSIPLKMDGLKVFNLLYCAPSVGPVWEGEAPKPSISAKVVPFSSSLLPSCIYSDVSTSFKTDDPNIRVQKLTAWDQESFVITIPPVTQTVQLLSVEMELKYQTAKQGVITMGKCSLPIVSYLLKPFLHDSSSTGMNIGSDHFYTFQQPCGIVPDVVSAAYADAKREERPFPCLGFSLSAM